MLLSILSYRDSFRFLRCFSYIRRKTQASQSPLSISQFIIHNIFLLHLSNLLIEAAKLLLTPRGRAPSQSPRETPRKPASVQQILYAIGGMSRREKLKSGERYDPKEGKWKPIGMHSFIMIIFYWNAIQYSIE